MPSPFSTDTDDPVAPTDSTTMSRRRFVGTAVAVGGASGLSACVGRDTEDNDNMMTSDLAFEEVSDNWGIDYEITGEATGSGYGGVVVGDTNRNGLPDLLAIGGDRPILYENDGDRFVTNERLPSMTYPPLKSAVFFDATGDGWEDLLLIPKSGEPIFLENSNGTFDAVERGLDEPLQWGTGAAAADFTGDGSLDIVIVQNGNWSATLPDRDNGGEATDGYENHLYRNTDGAFERVDAPNVSGSHWSLAVSATDLTGNGAADIHVANDFGFDVLLENKGDMSFDRRQLDNTNLHAMSSTIRDVNGNGHPDIFVTNIGFESPEDIWALHSGKAVRNVGNNLLINEGNGKFKDRADEYGVRRGGWGWAAAIEDFRNRGSLDIVHATLSYLEGANDGNYESVITPPALWEKKGDGFKEVSAQDVGFEPGNGRGLATLDLDGNGQVDVAIADTSGSIKLYKNLNDQGNWLTFDFRNRGQDAIGSTIKVDTDETEYVRRFNTRTDFFSQSTRKLHFGLGSADTVSVTVIRPDGSEKTVDDVAVNRHLVIEPDDTISDADPPI